MTPYSDGLEVWYAVGLADNRDGNAKRLILQGFDSWFIMNAMSLIANI